MNRDAVLWKRVLEKHRELEKLLDVFFGDREFNLCDTPADEDPFADFNPELFDDEDIESVANEEPNDGLAECLEASKNKLLVADTPVPFIDKTFERLADLWLTQSHTGLEHALLSMGLTRDVLPTKRPLLVFGSHLTRLTAPEYHRVEVKRDGWPDHPPQYSTERLTSTAAAKILATSETSTSSITDLTCFEGETVAVEVLNPLLAANRWIVIWPKLEWLSERAAEEPQWRKVRRVVWCVNSKKIGPRDLLDWLSRFWPDIPVRIALFRATSFVRKEQDRFAQAKVLPNVRQTLEKFDTIKGHPWIVVGP